MPQLRRYRFVVRDMLGNPIPLATVEVRKQGATIVSVGGATATVNDPGGIVAGDSCRLNAGTSDIGSGVASVTGTTVVFNASISGANNDRITPRSNLPTIYADAQAAEAQANPLTTGADGAVTWWALDQPTDLFITAGQTVALIQDFDTAGERHISNVFGTGTAIAHEWDTFRTLAVGDKLASFKHATAEKVFIDKDGKLQISDRLRVTAGGLLVDAGGITSTGASVLTGALSGVTSLTMTGALSGATTVSGTNDFTMRRLRPTQGTSVAVTDFALTPGWGTTATVSTAFGSDTRGRISIACSGTGQSANPQVTFTFKDGAFSGVLEPVLVTEGSATPITFWLVQAGGSTSSTWMFVGTPTAGQTYGVGWHMM